jgi:hypothetical protein
MMKLAERMLELDKENQWGPLALSGLKRPRGRRGVIGPL